LKAIHKHGEAMRDGDKEGVFKRIRDNGDERFGWWRGRRARDKW
jgi:hypothetical protein